VGTNYKGLKTNGGQVLQFTLPKVAYFIKNVNLWWGLFFKGREFGVPILKAQKLHNARLCRMCNLWNLEDDYFYSWQEMKDRF